MMEGFFKVPRRCRRGATRKSLPASGGMCDRDLDALFGGAPEAIRKLVPRMKSDGKRSIGLFRPWAWWLEITRGCNLCCGFCATRLFPRGEFSFMSEDTWRQAIEVIRSVSPVCRVEVGNAGEPTLNPRILDFMSIARDMCPTLQLMIYTNGTTLTDGRITYRDLFEAGLNMVFVDMYAPLEVHRDLAGSSGYDWFEQNRRPEGSINIFQYQGDPDVHAIMLCPNPGDWPRRKVKRGAFSTFFNHLDWEVASKHGLVPVVDPPSRRCDLPSKYPNVYWDGAYSFCCFDFMREVAGTLGNVSGGRDGFFRYWLGEYMQNVRRLLHRKDRRGHSMCSRCAFTSVRGDIPRWPPELLNHCWTGDEWRELNT
jgi:hypothetical protein